MGSEDLLIPSEEPVVLWESGSDDEMGNLMTAHRLLMDSSIVMAVVAALLVARFLSHLTIKKCIIPGPSFSFKMTEDTDNEGDRFLRHVGQTLVFSYS